jgi:amino acid transporter
MASWFTGWSNWMGQVTGAPSVNSALSAMILACASIANPGYTPTTYQTFLLTIFIMFIHACISSMPTLWIARINSYGSTFNMIGLVLVIILIPATVTASPKFNPSNIVWTIQNGTEWPDGIAMVMSFLAIIWTMSGILFSNPLVFQTDLGVDRYQAMMHPSTCPRSAPTRPSPAREPLS